MSTPHENLCENIYQLTCVYGRITAIADLSGISVATIQNIRRRENEDTKHSTVCALAQGISKHLDLKIGYQDLYSSPNSLRMKRAIARASKPYITRSQRPKAKSRA